MGTDYMGTDVVALTNPFNSVEKSNTSQCFSLRVQRTIHQTPQNLISSLWPKPLSSYRIHSFKKILSHTHYFSPNLRRS